jgi:hypothetical protein
MRWSLTTRAVDPVERLLRDNPVLLLSGPRVAGQIETLVRTWNPQATRDEDGVVRVADGVRWHGPFRPEPGLAAETGLPGGWSMAYVAQVARQRVRIPDGREGEALRRKYPKDMPSGAEALAWSLVTGLARLLGGTARLPGCAPYPPQPKDTAYCVYGNDTLPWQVLRTVVGLAIPDLARNGALAADDYCLDRPDSLEIRVRPFGDDDFLPYALRARAGDGWPRTVYRFSALRQVSAADTGKVVEQLGEGSTLLADVIGGVVLDAEGFPVAGAARADQPIC